MTREERHWINEIYEFGAVRLGQRIDPEWKESLNKLCADGLVYRASDWAYRLTPAGKIVASSLQ